MTAVLVAGYGVVGNNGARVLVAVFDPICELQACMEGFQVVTLESVVGEFDIFTSVTGCYDIIKIEHMKKIKNNAIVGNNGHFHNEFDMAGMEGILQDDLAVCGYGCLTEPPQGARVSCVCVRFRTQCLI